MLIIAIIIYWNVHRKRKKARLEKEKKENEIIAAEKPDDLLPHSTYLQTLMTLAGETLGKAFCLNLRI